MCAIEELAIIIIYTLSEMLYLPSDADNGICIYG